MGGLLISIEIFLEIIQNSIGTTTTRTFIIPKHHAWPTFNLCLDQKWKLIRFD
jgi:hypothetical protein